MGRGILPKEQDHGLIKEILPPQDRGLHSACAAGFHNCKGLATVCYLLFFFFLNGGLFVCLFVLLWIVCPSSAIECRGGERTIYRKLVSLILKSSDHEELFPDLENTDTENTVSPRDPGF